MIIAYNASKEERDRITAEREKKLYQSFENMRKQIDDQIQTMNFSTVSERVKRQQLEEIRHELQKQLQGHYNALEAGLKDDMVEVGGAVLKESEAFYSALQMPIGMSITSFPVEIMNNVVNGSVYQEKWYLSKALWGDYTEKLDQINEVISNGIGLNLPSKEIAKQLEQYVDPSAMTPSKTIVTPCLQDPVTGKLYSKDYVERHPEKDWTGFKEKDSKFRYGKVDYNAQRLARTLINHAYQQNVVHQAQANPFATGVRWDASGGERMCEICEERDGKIFPADDVPLDHPNGMCTFEVVTDLNMMEMSNVLADWVNGEPTEYDDKLYDWYNDRAITPERKLIKNKLDKNSVIELKKTNVDKMRSISDVEKAISKLCSFSKKSINLFGIELENAKDIYSSYEKVFSRFPWLKGKMPGLNSKLLPPKVFGQCYVKTGAVDVNSAYFKLSKSDLNSYYKRDIARGFHVKGTDSSAIVVHELGHSICNYFSRYNILSTNVADFVHERVMNVDGQYDGYYKFNSGMETSVSGYAAQDSGEFFAECFVMYISSDRTALNETQTNMLFNFEKALSELEYEYSNRS